MKARIVRYWPATWQAAMAAKKAQSRSVGVCQSASPSGAIAISPAAVDQIRMVSGFSVPRICRVMIRPPAQHSDDTSGISMAGWNTSVPGRRISITPMNPAPTAAQRRIPTFSPRNGIDSAVTYSGETKPIAVAVSSGRWVMACTNRVAEPISSTPRTTWATGRPVCQGRPRQCRSTAGTSRAVTSR
jgi:hypothetical protein